MIGAKIGGFANPDLFVQAEPARHLSRGRLGRGTRVATADGCRCARSRDGVAGRERHSCRGAGPDLTRRRRRHGKLAMHFMAAQHWENVLRYVHCDAVRDTALAGIDEQWDGMGILLFRDSAARRRHIGVPEARAALEADEDATFAERVSRNGLVARGIAARRTCCRRQAGPRVQAARGCRGGRLRALVARVPRARRRK